MKLFSILLMLFILPIFTLAQLGLKPGYIITNSGDTTRGFIKQEEEKKLMLQISFSNSGTGISPRAMRLDEINGFGFDDGNAYQKIHFADANGTAADVFAHYLVAGYYRLFSFTKDDREFFVVKNTSDSVYLLDDDILSTAGGIVEQGNFRNRLLFLARDCQSLKSHLDNINFITGELIDFIIAVNRCVAPSEATYTLYKKPAAYFRFYAYAGAMDFGTNKYEFTGRLMVRYIIPAVDGKTSLNFGAYYLKNSGTTNLLNAANLPVTNVTVTDIVSVPLIIQYNLIKGPVQPYINAGISLALQHVPGSIDNTTGYPVAPTTQFGVSFNFAAGLECPITPNLMIKADWTYELLLHYPVIGIAYWFK